MSDIKKIRLGLEIIEKVDPNSEVEYGHDIIYVGNGTIDKMSEEDKVVLDELGWFIERQYDCWAHF